MDPGLIFLFAVGGYVWYQSRESDRLIFNDIVRARYQGLSYYIILAGLEHQVPSWIIKRIGFIESRFDVNAVGSVGEIGFMQITAPVVSDFNNAQGFNYSLIEAGDPWLNVNIAAWLLRTHLNHYGGDIEKSVKAYNTGRGNIGGSAARRYWAKFQKAGEFFPEGI